MSETTRREFVCTASAAAVMAALSSGLPSLSAAERKLKLCLSPGAIGVNASQTEAISLAAKYGFEAVDPNAGYLATLSDGQLQDLLADMKAKGISWGAAGLPVEFRQHEAKFNEGMAALVKIAPVLRRAGVTRVTTWIMPCSAQLTYRQNFEQHVVRLRAAARVLADHGQRLGLEYVGTQSLRDSQKYPFLHTMAETRELIGEIGTGNIGLALDSWHWWTAGDSQADILALKNEDIVLVDLDDAPAGIAREQQIDSQRELPAATGVIDVGQFLGAVLMVGYDGPMRAEPFNKALNDMDNDAACAATIAALKKAVGKVPA
jgi:sugar phosphate isomerase/epimerase